MQHTQVVHGKDIFYRCRKCNVSFQGMEQMRDHARKFHSYNKIKQEREEQVNISRQKSEEEFKEKFTRNAKKNDEVPSR
jgi:ribosomal protein L34E